MVNEKKVAANRRNAKKSTGPRSSAGKARAKLNSIKHGLTSAGQVILDGECGSDFETVRAGFHKAWNPIGHAEVFLVDRMVQHGWRMGRAQRVEVELFGRQILVDEAKQLETALVPKFNFPATLASEFSSGLEPTDEADSRSRLAEKRLGMAGLRLGASFAGLVSGEDLLGKLQRYETAAERSFFRAAHELERLQRRRIGEHVAAPEVTDVEISVDQAALPDPNQPRVVRAPSMPEDRKAALSERAMSLPTADRPKYETNPTDPGDAPEAVPFAAMEGRPDKAKDLTEPSAVKVDCETKPLIDPWRALRNA